ncbi:RDD family protein [Patulibacter brassicae]|jgi:uncharacterized RDD family membrane protein YckC|uniref:RDD family protein n=1 Tax=Patulibacter brassicae TaxID=1705717 RepID=A0ABU4VIS6_9ACTN|nr:RDD family protein [Patulibacter brassicae]MDX8151731.1 RDD family protein [Patulibacter brassicae]
MSQDPSPPVPDDPVPEQPPGARRPERPDPPIDDPTGRPSGDPPPGEQPEKMPYPGPFGMRRPDPIGPDGRPLASWGRRVLAFVLDSMIIGLLSLLLGAIAEGATGEDVLVIGEENRNAIGLDAIWSDVGVGVAATLLATLLYVVPMLARTNGFTVGRRVARTQLVRADGQPIELWFATTREIFVKGLGVAVVAALPGLGPIIVAANYLWPMADTQRRALHDFPLDTRTVRTNAEPATS